MATALPYIYLAVAALGTAQAVQSAHTQGRQAEANANFQQDQANADARATQGAATIEAERIRKAGAIQRSQAVAAAAASGVDVNSPTALKIDETINHNAEQDAFLTMVGGNDSAARLRQGGQAAYLSGQSQKSAANAQATSAILSFASSTASSGANWKKAPNAPGPAGSISAPASAPSGYVGPRP
jgi:hypothetical protein